MDLSTWIPAMYLIGIVAFALVFACIPGCDKV
jgi:hypothetical protein